MGSRILAPWFQGLRIIKKMNKCVRCQFGEEELQTVTVEIELFGEAKQELNSEKPGMIQEAIFAGFELELGREIQ